VPDNHCTIDVIQISNNAAAAAVARETNDVTNFWLILLIVLFSWLVLWS